MFTLYPSREAVVKDIARIAAKTGQRGIAQELIDDVFAGNVEAVGFGYFGENGTLVFQEKAETLILHAVYSHELGLDEAVTVAHELAARRNLKFLKCETVRGGLAFKLVKRGWSATLSKRLI